MSISIETNLALICSAFNISYAKITNEYKGMTIQQIMNEEKAQGNNLAERFRDDLLTSPEKLVEFIRLYNPENKFAILSNFNEMDLQNLLPLLEKEDMILGLNFFSFDILVEMIAYLPSDQAANMALQMFSPEHLLYLLPTEAIDEVLARKEMKEMEGLERLCVELLPPEIKAQMIEAVTGEIPIGVSEAGPISGQIQFDDEALINQIRSFDKETFQESLFAIPPSFKQNFMFFMTQQEPKIWNMFNPKYYSMVIGARKEKEDIIMSANAIGHEQLVKMNSLLPNELLAVVLTQINSEKFAKVLQENFTDVLKELVVS